MSIFDIVDRAIKLDLKHGDVIKITPDELAVIILEKNKLDNYPIKPLPPIRSSGGGYGFFSFHRHTEYDHHAPDYLRQLKEYEEAVKAYWKRQNDMDYSNISLQIPKGTIKIEVETVENI